MLSQGATAATGRSQALPAGWAESARRLVGTATVLGVFAGIWYWGHGTHWSLPRLSGSADAAVRSAEPRDRTPADPTSAAPRKDAAAFHTIQFDSLDDVRVAGLAFAVARQAAVEDAVTTTAEVGYNQLRVAQLSSRVPGHVYAIRTRLGQAVKKGEVLALIDSEQVGRAKAEYLQEVFLARYKAKVLRRLRSAGGDAVPGRAVADAESALEEAELRRFTAQQRLINFGLHPPDPEADAPATPREFARHIQFLGLPDDVVAELRPRPQTANLIPLTAPFDGVVTRQEVVAGELAGPDKLQFVVADVSVMWVNLAVRKEDAGRLRLGQPVRFTAAGLPGPVCGTLDWVGFEADEKTRTVPARCEVANPCLDPARTGCGRLLRANLFGSATVVADRREAAVVVPDAAVQRLPDGTAVVFVRQTDGLRFEPRKVRLGLCQGGRTELLEGVAAGEAVVTDGSYVLKSELMKDSLAAA